MVKSSSTANLLCFAVVLLCAIDSVTGQRVRTFAFKNVDSKELIPNSLTNRNTVLDYDALGTDRLNIDFIANAKTESVRVQIDNPPVSYCESSAPFSLLRSKDMVGKPFPVGRRTVTAVPYSEKGCRGTKGKEFKRFFTVRPTRDSGSPPSTPSPPAPSPPPNPSNNDQRPNLIVIMTDQQRWDALSYAGNKVLRTPNMDRIAREGAYFSNAYTSSAVCGPARASLLTGLSIENTGVRRNDQPGKPNIKTYDEHLVRNEGYKAEYYGKWHTPNHFADAYQNTIDTASLNIYGPYRDFLRRKGYKFPPDVPPGHVVDTISWQPYLPNRIDTRFGRTENAERPQCECDQYGASLLGRGHTLDAMFGHYASVAIRRLAKDTKQPFSAHVSFNNPHAPHTPPKFYTDFYKAENMPVPPSINDTMVDSSYRSLRKARFSNPDTVGHMIAVYYAQMLEADVWVGNILRVIDEAGIANNTMLVFTTDHGEMLGSHGMIEKNVFYEESVRVPMLIRFPGRIRPGTRVSEPVSHRDLFPTILDYLGAKPQPSDGTSLRRYIEKTASTNGAFTVAESGAHNDLMVRSGIFKLIIPNKAASPRVDMLYNLRDDPYETLNLIGRNNPNRADSLRKANQMKDILLQWCIETNSPHVAAVRNRQL